MCFTILQSRCLCVVVDASGDTFMIHLICVCLFKCKPLIKHPDKHQHPVLSDCRAAYLDGEVGVMNRSSRREQQQSEALEIMSCTGHTYEKSRKWWVLTEGCAFVGLS